ncbi:MAG: hypothetical protein J2P28_23180, partial [Actinobacteria bacterium]|nr:hypothetical protein [Actinomycetota bacterium]
MTRFGVVASVVSAAVALLIVGAVTGDLALVYVSIALAALALVLLIIGVAVYRDQVFGGRPQPGYHPGPASPRSPAQVRAVPGQAPRWPVGPAAGTPPPAR